LFELAPEGELGMLLESDYVDRKIDVIQYMIAMGYDARQWDGKYYNAGVIVLSKCHRGLFVQPQTENSHFKEQTYLNLMISRTKTKVFPLPYRFNRMYFMDWLYGEHRCDCYLIHYAGVQLLGSEDEYLKMVATDRATWEHTRPHYRFCKHVAFVPQGNLSEQIATEPVIRYARDVAYRGDQIAIISGRPRLFRHLDLDIYPTGDQVPNINRYLPCYNLTNPARPPLAIDAQRVHAIDYASLNMLGIELPLAYRRPMLSVDPQARAAMLGKLGSRSPDDLVVMHPGRVAAGGDQDAAAWQSIARAMVEHGLQVALVGSRASDELPIVEFDVAGCVDLVDTLSLDEIIALVSEAPVLLSNDSAAVQIAGAFDRWIGLVGSTRHPEYVLPWRHGSQYFRGQAVTGGDERGERRFPEPMAVVDFVRMALQKS